MSENAKFNKEVALERLNEHLFASPNGVLSPVLLIDKETGEKYENWSIWHGSHGLFTFGYKSNGSYHYESFYSEEEIPYRIFVTEDYPLYVFKSTVSTVD